jgi:2-keto-3-deoxy-L-rhamnonate aldolase RhmA
MGHPGNPGAPAVAAAIADTRAKIVAAGKIPGLPATTDNVASFLGAGVRYIYTHLPRLLGAGSAAFLKAGRG